jgi:hypothetical protein
MFTPEPYHSRAVTNLHSITFDCNIIAIERSLIRFREGRHSFCVPSCSFWQVCCSFCRFGGGAVCALGRDGTRDKRTWKHHWNINLPTLQIILKNNPTVACVVKLNSTFVYLFFGAQMTSFFSMFIKDVCVLCGVSTHARMWSSIGMQGID